MTSCTASSGRSILEPPRRTPTSCARSPARTRSSARPTAAATSRPRRPTPTSTPRSTNVGVSAPDDKTVVVKLTKPATYFTSVMALWIAVPVQEKWITSPNATEAGELRRLRPVHPRHLGPQQPDRPQAEPELVRRRQADPDRDRHVHDDRAGPGPGGVRGRRARHGPDAERGHPAGQGGSDPRPAWSSTSRTLGDHLLHLQQQDRPDGQQGLPDRADPGDRQEGLHRRDVRRRRRARQQLRDAGHPGLPGGPRSVSVRPGVRPRST